MRERIFWAEADQLWEGARALGGRRGIFWWLRRKFWPAGAKFRVVRVDPECSGLDFQGHEGAVVERAKRCCERCSIIFGIIEGTDKEFGPFGRNELEPLNRSARTIHAEIDAHLQKIQAR